MAWVKTKFPGVRYREHPTRKLRNGQLDRYFTIRYRVGGILREERLGWASEEWTAEKAHGVLSKLKEGITTGSGPESLAEKRKEEQAKREADRAAQARDALAGMSLRDFFEKIYLSKARKEKRSWKIESLRIAKRINPLFGDIPLRAMTSVHVQTLIDTLEADNASPATIRQYLSIVCHVFNVASETIIDGVAVFTGQNPALQRFVRIPTIHNARERYLTAKEADALISAARKEMEVSGNADMHDTILLSLNTGLRLGELMRLDWLDVDFVAGFLTVREEAMRKPGGKVPLNKTAEAVFARRAKVVGHNGGMVFEHPAGPEIAQQAISRRFAKLAEAVGLNANIAPDDRRRRVVFHSLRHTFASWLALAGVDLYRIKTLMRHRSITMTMRYAHLIPDATRDAVHNLRPPKGS